MGIDIHALKRKLFEALESPSLETPTDELPPLDLDEAKLGSGARFKAVEKNAAKNGAKDPAAVAASVGIKKYGKAKMEKMAHAHENTEVLDEDGVTAKNSTNPGKGAVEITYTRDDKGIRQTTGQKPIDKQAQRDKYKNYGSQYKVENSPILLKNLVKEDEAEDGDYMDAPTSPGMQMPESKNPMLMKNLVKEDAADEDNDMSYSANGAGMQLPEDQSFQDALGNAPEGTGIGMVEADGGGNDPSEEAHKLGLTAAGWGYWKDKTGRSVAKTVQGQLVKLAPGEEAGQAKDYDDVESQFNPIETKPNVKYGSEEQKGIQNQHAANVATYQKSRNQIDHLFNAAEGKMPEMDDATAEAVGTRLFDVLKAGHPVPINLDIKDFDPDRVFELKKLADHIEHYGGFETDGEYRRATFNHPEEQETVFVPVDEITPEVWNNVDINKDGTFDYNPQNDERNRNYYTDRSNISSQSTKLGDIAKSIKSDPINNEMLSYMQDIDTKYSNNSKYSSLKSFKDMFDISDFLNDNSGPIWDEVEKSLGTTDNGDNYKYVPSKTTKALGALNTKRWLQAADEGQNPDSTPTVKDARNKFMQSVQNDVSAIKQEYTNSEEGRSYQKERDRADHDPFDNKFDR